MKDGLYQVSTPSFCAGFVVEQGKVINCAPILKRKFEYWCKQATYIGNNLMQITVLSVNTEKVKTAKGFYEKAEVAFKGEDGKVSGKNVMSFVNQKVFDTLKGCSGGEILDITSEKDEKGYWQWTAVSKLDANTAPAPTASKPVATPKSTYETPEERAIKQRNITRQFSINAAIQYMVATKNDTFGVNDVLEIAQDFEDHVYATVPAKFDENFVGDEDQVI